MSKKPIQLLPDEIPTVGAKPTRAGGGWLNSSGITPASPKATALRDRIGWSHAAVTSSLYDTPTSHYSFYQRYRSLYPEQYWQLYKTTPDVRACVDTIVRRIATWDWYIKVNADPRDTEKYERLTKEAARVQSFLARPSTDGTTWQEMMTALVTDIMVYDAGVIELVNDDVGRLVELKCWLGSEWFPVIDKHGHLLYYEQQPEDMAEEPVQVNPENLAYFKLYNNTRSALGLPILETVINECLTAILSSEHAMLAMDADEIPPGLLVLGGVAGPAAERARADMMAMKGKDSRIRVVTSPQPNGIEAKWLELRHTPKDLELMNVVDQMRRAIWRTFGVMPVELGETTGVPRAAAEIQMDVSSSHLISPILELVQARINQQIVKRIVDPDDLEELSFTFDRVAPTTSAEKLDTAKRAEILLKKGVMTVNEVRAEMGYMPIAGGDIAIVETSLGPMPLEQVSQGLSPAVTLPFGDQAPSLDDAGTDPEGVEQVGDLVVQPEGLIGEEEGVAEVAAEGLSRTPMQRNKYEGIDFSVPKGVKAELERGLKWHEEGHSGDGLRQETVSWARRMYNGQDISPDKARKMRAWLARHEVDKEGKGFEPGEDGFPSPGRVAWALWGGDPAVAWSNKLVRQMEAAEAKKERNLSDLSGKVQTALKKKAADFNEKMEDGGFASWRRTTAKTLAAVFKRGVGAYNTNPESVRPSVSSADQWAYARVNSYLYVLEKDKFKSGKHDTDLLPKEHPLSTKSKSVSHDHPHDCGCPLHEHTHPGPHDSEWRFKALSSNEWLPSDWQPAGKFKNYRTVDLGMLAGAVEDYTKDIAGLYIDTANEIQSVVIASYKNKTLSVVDSARAQKQIDAIFDSFLAKWSTITIPHYMSVTRMGYEKAAEFSRGIPEFNPSQMALAYHNDAMIYLQDSDGLVGTLREKIRLCLQNATLAQRDRIAEIEPGEGPDGVVRVIDEEFGAQRHRIKNWSGKLVALGSMALVAGLRSFVPVFGDSAQVWYYEWVAESGKNCPTCAFEKTQGIRPLSELSTYPADGTICGANCRCVLVYWTGREVEDDEVVLLSSIEPV